MPGKVSNLHHFGVQLGDGVKQYTSWGFLISLYRLSSRKQVARPAKSARVVMCLLWVLLILDHLGEFYIVNPKGVGEHPKRWTTLHTKECYLALR